MKTRCLGCGKTFQIIWGFYFERDETGMPQKNESSTVLIDLDDDCINDVRTRCPHCHREDVMPCDPVFLKA